MLTRLGSLYTRTISSDRTLNRDFVEANALLHAMGRGDIRRGQPRLAKLLERIIERWPGSRVPTVLLSAVQDAAWFGLTAGRQRLNRSLKA